MFRSDLNGITGCRSGHGVSRDDERNYNALADLAKTASSILLSRVLVLPPPDERSLQSHGIPSMISKATSSYLGQQCQHQSSSRWIQNVSRGLVQPQFDQKKVEPQPSAVSTNNGKSAGYNFAVGGISKNNMTFPLKLMYLLCDESLSNVITWLPHGNAFAVYRPGDLVNDVLPTYFASNGPAKNDTLHKKKPKVKYASFTRKLNRWGFRMIHDGPDAGAFHHHLFCRDRPELCLQMSQQTKPKRRQSNEDSLHHITGLPLKKRFKTPCKTNDTREKPTKRSKSILTSEDTSSDGETETTYTDRSSLTNSSLAAPVISESEPSSTTRPTTPCTEGQNSINPMINTEITVTNMAVPPSPIVRDPSSLQRCQLTVPSVATSQISESITSNALKQRNQLEVLRASQAMLRYAFLQALLKEE